MNHLEFAALESAALEPTKAERAIDLVEHEMGHCIDGDQDRDGYSIDAAYALHDKGFSPSEICGIFSRKMSWAKIQETYL